jgi:hypothetical protein
MAMTLASWSHEEVFSVIQFLWVKHVSPIEIHCQLIEVYGDGIMSVQYVRKGCREFESGHTNIHDVDCTSWPSTSRMDVNAA